MFNKKRVLILVCMVVALIATSFAIFKFIPKSKNAKVSNIKSNFTIVADSVKNSETLINTGFTITSTIDYTEDELRNKINITDNKEYELTKTGEGTYYLKPKENLDAGSIFNVSINETEDEPGNSWAFQTETDFRVVSTSPVAQSTYVAIDTGIEIEFSKTPEFTENFIEITPKVEGRYEINGKRLIFVPKGLKEGTEYNVIVKNGVKSIFGDIMAEDYSFKFKTRTYSSDNNYMYFSAENMTTSVLGTKFIKIGAEEAFNNEKLNVKIYKFNETSDYIDFLKDPKLLDINKHSLVSSFESQLLIYTEDYYDTKYILLPENLEAGQYLVDISTGSGIGKAKNRNTKGTIQVTDIATYIQSYNGETLVWCNDIATNEVVKNARVKVGNQEIFTNDSGIAVFNTKEGENQSIIVTDDKNRSYATYEWLNKEADEILDDRYYTYLYTDREVYMPTDTIKYWGIVLPKSEGLTVPKDVNLIIDEEEVILPVNSHGSFSGEYSFTNRVSGYVDFTIKLDGLEKYLTSKDILEYVKPTYNITSSYDKSYYVRGDQVNINIEAEFFDETPAYNLNLSTSTSSHKENVVTDLDGKAKVSFTPVPSEGYGWEPYNLYTTINTIEGEEDAGSYNSVRYFPTNYSFDAKWEDNILTLNSNILDIKNDGKDYEKGLPASATATVKIFQSESIKTEVGEYYDFINKKNVKKYEYSTKKTQLDEFSCNIDGSYSITTLRDAFPNITYYAEIYYTLADGFNGKTTAYLNSNSYIRRESSSKRYSFSRGNYQKYAVNEKIHFEVLENDNKFLNNGRVIYTILTDKLEKSTVILNTSFDISFIKDYIPMCVLAGAYFDGNVLYPIEEFYLYFDETTRELDIDISTDKKSYKPGEKVKVNVSAKDKNGIGRKTNMVISVVDEAVFAVYEQYTKPLEKLYQKRYYDLLQYVSHEQLMPYITAESGGEGGPERSIFKDTAAFIPVTTNSNGEAIVEFTLPDNLTSWRITAVGITLDIYAGSEKHNITTNLPFFINQVVNLKYTSSDDFVFSGRVVGDEKLFFGKSVEYVSTLTGNGINKELKLTRNYGETAAFNYGKLPEGEYEVSVSAKCGNYSDAIRKTIPVYNSLQEIDISKKLDLDKKIDIQSLRFPVQMRFYDKNNEFYYSVIRKVLSSSYGSTSDQILTRSLTYMKLDEIEGLEKVDREINIYQDYTGGATLLPYSDTDALLTAKICAVAPEYIDVSRAKTYFRQIIKNKKSTSNQVSAAYFGLAALKEPVLNEIKFLLDNNKGFEFKDNINLILGLAYIGDYSGANEYYNKILSQKMKKDGDYLYIDIGNFDENYEATSNLAMILTRINNVDFRSVLRYVMDKKSNKYTPAIDLIDYVLSYNPKKDSDGYIEYDINGNIKKVTFNEKRVNKITLNKNQLEGFSIKSVKDVEGFVYYVGGIEDAISKTDNKIEVKKTYSESSKVGDFTVVTVNIKFPSSAPKKSYYMVSDVVPSGMRFVSLVRENTSKYGYLDKEENQKLYFSVYNETGEATLQYKVRSVLPGNYLMESAVVSHLTNDITGYSERGNVKINEK